MKMKLTNDECMFAPPAIKSDKPGHPFRGNQYTEGQNTSSGPIEDARNARTNASRYDRQADKIRAIAKAEENERGSRAIREIESAADNYNEAADRYRRAEVAYRAGNELTAQRHEERAERLTEEADDILKQNGLDKHII